MAQDPWHPGDKQSHDSVLTEKHAATRLHPSPEQTRYTLDKQRIWVQMSTVRSVQPQLHSLTELHNKPPNHQLATRNLSSSCEETPTPDWRREYREDGWRVWESRPEKMGDKQLHNVLSAWAIFSVTRMREQNIRWEAIRASLGEKRSGSNLHFWEPQPRMSSPWKNNNETRVNKRLNNSIRSGQKCTKADGPYLVFLCRTFVFLIKSKLENAMWF